MGSSAVEVSRFLSNICDGFILNIITLTFYSEEIIFKKVALSSLLIGAAYFAAYQLSTAITNNLYSTGAMLLQVVFGLLFLKISSNKSLLKLTIPVIIQYIIAIIFNLFLFILLSLLNMSFADIKDSELWLIVVNVLFWFIEILLIITIKNIKNKVKLGKMKAKDYLLFILFLFLCCLILAFNGFMFLRYVHDNIGLKMAVILSVIYLFYLLSVVVLGVNFVKSQISKTELESQKVYNETMRNLIDDLKVIKHGYDNNFASIQGFIKAGKWNELSEYVDSITLNHSFINASNLMMCQNINNPGLAGLIMIKLEFAKQRNISSRLIVKGTISEHKMSIVELCEALGIIIDNAIDAASESKDKYIKINISNNEGTVIFSIENSCCGKQDILKIFQKGFSTKGEGRGLGLWILKNIVNKNKNVLLNTLAEKDNFKQELIIY